MASGQMNFNMRFTADTSQAQSAIQQLQTSLSQIAMAGSGAGVSKGMTEAASAAKELSYHLNQAYNATTGNFDLSRLDKSLRTSNTNVTKLSSSLLQAGQSGQQAFVQLAQSIASADRPMINLSSRMTDLFTTIKNTAKWQISSSILHGFMGAVQQAYGYAQDLNESLNNIRIVTGYNTEQMAAFAEKANKAAKALSTTTTAYTNAALIYYQQGLAESEIEERTAVTVKMANVSGQNAEKVSDQMTAVWNNFYDGSKSLEYYADVMTKLGAATASSSDEIAQGLEKFAAVSETVGLSYEYATAALATLTAETRQSADVVGTAFKTLFARIQGLKLGETLEDGTDLNQYSEALMAVGVNIKDTNGELKDMDTILNEMAAVWRTLNKDEQTALAQKVAGIRQYTQLIALMENWDVMEQNLGFVEMSEGSLQEQQDIYEESWKAASDRVRASMESIYSDLLDDEFFIDLTNGFSSLIDSLDAFIDGFGGVKMIVTSVASILMATFAHKVPAALENLKANFNVVFKGAVTQAQELSNKMVETTNQVLNNKGINLSASDRQALESANQLNIAKNRLLEVEGKLTPLEKQRYQTELLILQAQQEEVQASVQDNENKKKALNLAEQELQIAREAVKINETKNFDEEKAESIVEKDRGGIEQTLRDDYLRRRDAYQTNMSSENLHALKESETALFSFANNSERARGIFDNFLNTLKNGYDMEMRLNQGNIELSSSTLAVGNAFADYTSDLTNLQASLNNGEISFKQVKNSMIDLESQLKLASGGIIDFSKEFAKIQTAGNNKQLSSAIDELIKKITSAQIPAKDLEKVLNKLGQNKYTKNAVQGYDELRQKIQQVQNKSKEYQQSLEQTKKKQQELNSFMSNFNPTHVVTGIERVTQAAAGLGQTAMLIQSFRSLIEAWNNDDLTFGEKLTTSFMSISMIVPSAMGAIRSFNTVLSAGDKTLLGQIALRRTSNALMQQEVAQTITNAATQQMANIIKNEGQQIDEKTIQAGIKRMLASKGIENANLRDILSLLILNQAKKNNKIATEGETVASGKLTLARIIENAASQSLLTTLGQLMVLLWPYLAIMAALAIAITGVVLVVNALSDAYNAEAIAAERANKELKEQQDNLEETKNKYQELTAAIEDYKESESALDKLTRGTEEWKEQVEELNKQVIDLITKYPELAKYVVKDNVTGVLGFTEEDLEYVQEVADQAVKNEEFKTYSRQIESNTANKTAEIKIAGQDWVPDVQESNIQKLNEYIELYKTGGEEALAEVSVQIKTFARVLGIGGEELLDKIRSWGNIDTTNDFIRQQQASLIASSNENYQNSKYQDIIDQQIASILETSLDEIELDENKKVFDSEETQKEYLKLKYGNNADQYQFTDVGIAGKVTLQKKDEDGNWINVNNERNNITRADLNADYEKLLKEDERKKSAEQYNIDATLEALNSFEQELKDFGISDEGAEALTRAKSSGEKVNLGELSETDIEKIRDLSEVERRTAFNGQLTQTDLDQYDAQGGSLGARNASFSELYQAVENPAEGSNEEALAQLKTFRDEALNVYNELNEEDKRLFAETMDFKTAMSVDTMKQILESEKQARADAKLDSEAEKYDLDADVLKAQAAQIKKSLESAAKSQDKMGKSTEKLGEGLKKTGIDMEDTADLAAEMAVANQRMNKGVDKLTDNWKDWKKTLKGTDKTTQDYNEAVTGVSDSLRDILRLTDDELIPADFITSDETIDLLDQVANGSEEAVSKLGYNLAKAQIEAQEITSDIANNLANMFEGQDLSTEQLENKFQNIKTSAIAAINEMQAKFAKLDPGEGLGGNKATEWANALNQYAQVTGMSVEAMQSMLNKLQVKADVKVESKTIKSKVPVTEKVRYFADPHYEEIDGRNQIVGYKQREYAHVVDYVDADEVIQVAQINTDQPVNFTKVDSGTITPSVTTGGKSSGKGGGGSSPKKATPTKKSDVVDRYKEQDDQLDDLKRTIDNTADSLDRLYGEEKLEAIDKLIQAEKDYKNVLKEKRSEARDALDEDRKALDAAASKVSVEFEYDAEGNLINYTEQMEALYNRLRSVEKAAGAEWTESEQKQIDALKEKIEALKEAKEQYEDTRELIEDLSDELTQLAGKPAMPLIKSDTVDIYREISDALDDIEDRLDRIARKSDNALGKNRLNYFKNFQGASEEKLSLLEDEIANSTTDIRQNKTYLNRVTKLLDVDKVQYDKKGNITNYDEITDILWDRIFQFQEEAKKGGITPAEQQGLDALYDDLNLFTSSSEKYRDSVEYREDLRLEKEELTEGVKVLPVVTNDFLDIYKEADDILDDIDEKISRISEEADRATGKDKVAKLKELAKLEKERLAYIKKEQEINKSDKQEKRKALGTARKKLGISTKFKFDENGNITNYNEIMQEYEQKYAEAYALAAADGTITAGENEWLEKFKEDGQYLEEYIQQYSDAVEKGEELEQAAIDAAYAAEDYLLEALNFTIEFGIEANDRDLQYIEFQLSQIEDQAYMTAEAMALLDKKYQNLQKQTDIYTDGINTILSDNFTQDEINQVLAGGDLSGLDLSKISQTELDMLNSYVDGLMGLQEELLALRDTMDEAVIKAFEEWTAEMQEQLSLFDHYDSVINSYTNIIDLVGQERLGITDENIKEYNQLKVTNATNRLTSSKAYYEETGEKIQLTESKRAEAEARLAAAQASGDASAIAAAEKDVKMWDETLKTMYQENRNAEQQYLADWEAALQASRDAFLAETDIQLKALEEQMAGTYGTIANMQEEFKRQQEKNDRYLQDYEKIYELSKLNRDLTNKMDETTNIKAKKELAKLQEEILDYQKEGRQMSDYDLKYLKKKYELKLAEIALEEAQNAKTQVRLTRDSEGNYSYTYTADEDEMAKAQQSYEDKLYEITNLSNDYIEQQTSKLLSAQQEYVNKLAEIHKKAAEGQYATTEEYQQALDEVTAYYTDLMTYYGGEIDKAAENNATVYENDFQTYQGFALGKAGASKAEAEEYISWVQAKSVAEAGFVTSITELLPGLSDAHTDATGYVQSMVGAIGSAEEGTGLLGQASKSYDTFNTNVEEAMAAAGTSMDTFKDTAYQKLITDEDSVANASEAAKNNILGIVSATDALDDTITSVANWQAKYSAELQKIIDKAGEVITAINKMNLVLAQQVADEEDAEDPKPDSVVDTLENPITDLGNDEKKETTGLTQTATSLITSVIPDIVKKTNLTTEDDSNKLETLPEKTKKGIAYSIWSGYWGNGESRKKLVNKKLGDGAYKTYQSLVNDYDIEAKAKNGTWEKDLFGKYLAAGEGQKKLKNTYGPSAFFTGGYTGAWGPDGKLAILHEKELVLNKQDTENMLKIVSMVRDLSAALDSKAYYASLAQLQASQLYQVHSNGETFEQTVTIHAEFPHATSAIEIETALNNLVNSASQYSNRK